MPITQSLKAERHVEGYEVETHSKERFVDSDQFEPMKKGKLSRSPPTISSDRSLTIQFS